VEERKISFREKSNVPDKTQSAPVRIDMEVYDQITDISDRSGLSIREVTSRLLKFSLGNIEWEN
jgi:hypothetical protein